MNLTKICRTYEKTYLDTKNVTTGPYINHNKKGYVKNLPKCEIERATNY